MHLEFYNNEIIGANTNSCQTMITQNLTTTYICKMHFLPITDVLLLYLRDHVSVMCDAVMRNTVQHSIV